MIADDDDALKSELLRMDVQLRRKQVAWETPRNIFILFSVLAALLTSMIGVAGFVGFRIGQGSPMPPIIINVPK